MERNPRPGNRVLKPVLPCRWDLSPAEAREEQQRLRRLARSTPLGRRGVRLVAGCDVGGSGRDLVAAVAVLRLPRLEVVELATARGRARMPYVPGLLSFRETPVLLRAFARLRSRPDAVLCDAQGRAHPRRFGLACHLGVLLDLPTVGCAKSRLVGEHGEPARHRGAEVPLREGGEVIGSVLRTREGVKPVFVSTGHRTTLRDAVWLVLRATAGFRLPEPTRLADRTVRRLAS